jgi:AAHS family 4-hydroxybenzoate transporter-like MFS transporter
VAFAGPIARALIGSFGWRGVFWFGGAASAVSAVLLLVALPESLRFLTARGASAQRIISNLGRLAPGLVLPAGAQFMLSDEADRAGRAFHPGVLFAGVLRWITPLLWLAFIASSLSTYFLTTWGPLVLEEMGFSANQAAWLTFANSLCGMVGALAIMGFTDSKGAIAIGVLPAVAVPLLLAAGLAPVGLGGFLVLSLILSVFLGGSHYAIQSVAGTFYPSIWRSNGSGWAGSVAKVGSIAAPIIGAAVLSTAIPVRQTYALLAICPAIFAVCAVVIGVIDSRMRRADLAAPPTADAQPILAGE